MKVIPLEKQSKAAQKEFHDQQRGNWNGIVPVTRIVPDKKKYNRNRDKNAYRRDRDTQ